MTHDDTEPETSEDTAPIRIDPFAHDEQPAHVFVGGVSRSGITAPADASAFEDDEGGPQ